MRKASLFLISWIVLLRMLCIILPSPSLAQEWAVQVKPKGTLKVVDLFLPSASVMFNYVEGLVGLDRDNRWIPCLAKDWRWITDKTVEFKLRRDVRFHNGEEFDAEAVRINWEAYKKLVCPRVAQFLVFPDETVLDIIDKYLVLFTLPEPDALAFAKFGYFFIAAPSFFVQDRFEENGWGYFKKPGPWGTGPFELVEGGIPYAKPSGLIVLEANRDYWDPRYPRAQRVIFDNILIRDREEAMRLCMSKEGSVDIVSFIRPLDTLKVAESRFARVVKSKDISWFGALINQRKTDSKWRDVRLRKAINLAINREELWQYAAKGNAYNLGAIWPPPGTYGHNPNLAPWPYDIGKARDLIKEAGYPDGFEMKAIAMEAFRLEAQIICKMLARIGLRSNPEALPMPKFLQKMYIAALDKPPEEQEWDLAFYYDADLMGHTASFYGYWTRDSLERWMEYDPVFEEMYREFVRTIDLDEQEEKVRKLAKYRREHAYRLDVYSPFTLYAVNKEVELIPQKSIWLRLKETSVTENHWSLRGKNH